LGGPRSGATEVGVSVGSWLSEQTAEVVDDWRRGQRSLRLGHAHELLARLATHDVLLQVFPPLRMSLGEQLLGLRWRDELLLVHLVFPEAVRLAQNLFDSFCVLPLARASAADLPGPARQLTPVRECGSCFLHGLEPRPNQLDALVG